MNRPTGTVTFLFTDIEGSTPLWEKYPDAMRLALQRHDAILRHAVEAHRGHVIKTTGDGVHAVFARAQDAAAACVAAQRALQMEKWDERTPIRARMGLHTGAAEERDGDYYGPVLNRAARLMAAGHGGQMLLSQATYDLLRDEPPGEFNLRDLGEHRLKDMSRSEHVYQLGAPGLSLDFPKLRTLNVLPNNLPIQLTSFIGREKEIDQVKAIISATRLVTLTGVGGVGKTRLAFQVAAEMLEIFPDGVWLVELAALSDPSLVPQGVGAALGVREEQNRAMLQTLVDHFKMKNLLLVLDNCEHLIDVCIQLVQVLLQACPQLKVLATSREALGIGGEKIFRVPSLSIPNVKLPLNESFRQSESVRLFLDRAGALQPGFELTFRNAPAVAQICQRLDGIPLAIELAAARVKALNVEELALRLDDRFRLLTGGSRTALPRHQTLRALMDWSYDLLSEKERVLLRRLAIFAGSWTLEAAEEICNGDGVAPKELFDLLAQLVDKSLVNVDWQGEETRYQMLGTVRQYALGKLIDARETERVRERHLSYYTDRAEEGTKLTGADGTVWLNRMAIEQENLRAALEWAQSAEGGSEIGLRLSGALGRFWEKQNALTEGREWLKRFLDLSKYSANLGAEAKALDAAARLADLQSDYASAIAHFERRLEIAESERDDRNIADAHMGLGKAWWRRGDYDRANQHFAQAVQRAETLGDTVLLARAHGNSGLLLTEHGDLDRAIASHRASLEAFLQAGLDEYVGRAYLNLGRIFHLRGEFAQAAAYYLESIRALEAVGDQNTLSIAFNNLGELHLDQGNYSEAFAFIQKSIAIAQRSDSDWTLSVSYRIIAGIYLEQRQTDLALSYIERALQQKVQSEDQLALIYFRRAEIRTARGERTQARADFEAARTMLEKLRKKSELARLYRSYGSFLADGPETWQDGRDYLEKARTLFRELGSAKEVEKTTRDLQKFST